MTAPCAIYYLTLAEEYSGTSYSFSISNLWYSVFAVTFRRSRSTCDMLQHRRLELYKCVLRSPYKQETDV